MNYFQKQAYKLGMEKLNALYPYTTTYIITDSLNDAVFIKKWAERLVPPKSDKVSYCSNGSTQTFNILQPINHTIIITDRNVLDTVTQNKHIKVLVERNYPFYDPKKHTNVTVI